MIIIKCIYFFLPDVEPPVQMLDRIQEKEEVGVEMGSVFPRITCPLGWARYGNRCFIFIYTQKTWAEAEVHPCILCISYLFVKRTKRVHPVSTCIQTLLFSSFIEPLFKYEYQPRLHPQPRRVRFRPGGREEQHWSFY